MPALVTPRMRLREWRDQDLDAYATMSGDPRVREFYPDLLTREQCAASMRHIQEHFARNGFGMWAAELTDGAPCIGFIGLQIPAFDAPFTPCVEIGWYLAHEHWGRGYATEGARAALAFGFESLGLKEIVAMTTVSNARSRHVMEKLGMTRNPTDDFDHPNVPAGHPLRRHVLYRVGTRSLFAS